MFAVLIVLIGITVLVNYFNDKDKASFVPPTRYDSEGNRILYKAPLGRYFLLLGFFAFLTFYGFPVFVVILSALYLLDDPSHNQNLKSLLIPVSYAVLAFISSYIWLIKFAVGEEGMAAIYVWMQLAATFFVVLLTNGIILLIKRKQKTNP